MKRDQSTEAYISQERQRNSQAHAQRRDSLSEEAKADIRIRNAEAHAQRRDSLSEEARTDIRIRDAEAHAQRWDSLSEEAKADIRLRNNESQSQRRRSLSAEAKTEIQQNDTESQSQRRRSLSVEAKSNILEQDSAQHQQFWNNSETMMPFINHMKSYAMRTCESCLETWPSRTRHKCCKKSPFVFSPENDMYPFVDENGTPIRDESGQLVQEELFEDVTPIEEMLIAKAFPLMRVYQLHGNGNREFQLHRSEMKSDRIW
jgi:multidrug efflux pump subunit AcrA (membrane-fusion protein)